MNINHEIFSIIYDTKVFKKLIGGICVTKEIEAGCSRPEIIKNPEQKIDETPNIIPREEKQKMIKVGKPAPAFTAPAFYEGKFTNVSLDDYKGKWVLLGFYPGDFTFV